MILKLKTLILRLKIWKTKTKLPRAEKIRKYTVYKEYKTILSEIASLAKQGVFATEQRIIDEATIKKLENDGFDVRNTNFSNIYVISWRTIK